MAAAVLALAAGCAAEPPPPEPPNEPPPAVRAAPPPPPPVEGILCFRGGPRRDHAGRGEIPRGPVEVAWSRGVGGIGPWTGLGWTGQPLLAAWGAEALAGQEFLTPTPPRVEVVAAGLDGKVHFFDLDGGAPTRAPLAAQDAPIKGTPSLDPRGIPVLYVGQGLPGRDGGFHYRGISLVDGSVVLDLPGRRSRWGDRTLHPFRGWGAFDGNALVLPDRDLLLLGGENGLVYRVGLGLAGRPAGALTGPPGTLPAVVDPLTYHAVRPKWGGGEHDGTDRWAAGIESSVAFHGGVAYWTDNVGSLIGHDLDAGREVLRLDLGDDTDATPVIAVEDGRAYLYVGSEVDKRLPGRPLLAQGTAWLSKVDLARGTFAWRLGVSCWTQRGEDPLHDVNGGILSTVALGSGPSADLAFVATAREPTPAGGRLLAVRREAGPGGEPRIAWAAKLKGLSWSSPATDGRTVVVGDSAGWLHAFDAVRGEPLWDLPLGGAVESSPVFWEGDVVVGVRGGKVVRVRAAQPTAPALASPAPRATPAPREPLGGSPGSVPDSGPR